MKKYFYFRDVADEDADDDILSSIAIPVDSIAGVVPVAITTLEVYLRKNGLVGNTKVTLTVMNDAVTTDYGGTTRGALSFSNDVTAVAIAAAGY